MKATRMRLCNHWFQMQTSNSEAFANSSRYGCLVQSSHSSDTSLVLKPAMMTICSKCWTIHVLDRYAWNTINLFILLISFANSEFDSKDVFVWTLIHFVVSMYSCSCLLNISYRTCSVMLVWATLEKIAQTNPRWSNLLRPHG